MKVLSWTKDLFNAIGCKLQGSEFKGNIRESSGRVLNGLAILWVLPG